MSKNFDGEAAKRIVREVDAICQRERENGTSMETIEMALLHLYQRYAPPSN